MCFLGFHKWSFWSEKMACLFVERNGNRVPCRWIQERTCLKCGHIDQRTLSGCSDNVNMEIELEGEPPVELTISSS